MISEESKSYIDDMAAQAADLESRCATAKPARLPKHELAYYIMDNHFRASQVICHTGICTCISAVQPVRCAQTSDGKRWGGTCCVPPHFRVKIIYD